MAGDDLIRRYLAVLERRLPAEAVEEIEDGLTEAYGNRRRAGLDPAAAAQAAINEFGEPDVVIAEFVRQSPGRRAAWALIGSGPAVGACWALSLVLGRAWTWAVPIGVPVIVGSVLLAVIVVLLAAATGRRSVRRTKMTAGAALGLIGLDCAVLTILATTAPLFVWPMALAVPASLTRVALTARALPRIWVASSATRTP